jgi:hypothetical protein
MGAKLDTRRFQISIDRERATKLANRLDACAMGENEMTPVQVKAAQILLDKLVPNLSAVQHSGDEENPVTIRKIERVIVNGKPATSDG